MCSRRVYESIYIGVFNISGDDCFRLCAVVIAIVDDFYDHQERPQDYYGFSEQCQPERPCRNDHREFDISHYGEAEARQDKKVEEYGNNLNHRNTQPVNGYAVRGRTISGPAGCSDKTWLVNSPAGR